MDRSSSSRQRRPSGQDENDSMNSEKNMWAKARQSIAVAIPDEIVVDKKKQYGYCHAFIMLFCFCIVLGTVYTQQQTYKYTATHTSLMRVTNSDLAGEAESIDDIWNWLDSVVSNIGSRTIDHIEGNCAYDATNSQTVTIDGQTYSFVNPALQTTACDLGNLDFILGGDDEVYLTGNNMILSFGVFSDRSSPYYPIKKSSTKKFKVRSDDIKTLDPVRDDKIVEICAAQWTDKCLLRDGFAGQAGSTFDWTGKKYGDKYVYENSSFAMLFSNGADPQFIYPCYSYAVGPTFVPENSGGEDPDVGDAPAPAPATPGDSPAPTPAAPVPVPASSPTIKPTPSPVAPAGPMPVPASPTSTPTSNPAAPMGGPPPPTVRRQLLNEDIIPGKGADDDIEPEDVELVNCTLTWVSSGYDIRAGCLRDGVVQPSAFESFLAAKTGYADVRDLQNYYFGCYNLEDVDTGRMEGTYVEASTTLQSYLEGYDSYGMFFSTENQENWIIDSREGMMLLKRHKYIDENTRTFRVFCITRNLGENELFYSMLIFEFQISTVGKIEVDVEAKYVPIIQYMYGVDGYQWRVKEVYVLELMMLVIFVLFVLREVHQLLTVRVLSCFAHVRHWTSKRDGMTIAPTEEAVENPPCVESGLPSETPVAICSPHEEDKDNEVGSEDGEGGKGGMQKGGSRHVADIGDEIDQAIQDMDDKLSELGDVLEDYLPDVAGWNDILDWCTILVLVLGMAYRIAYVTAAEDFHEMVLQLEKERNYDDKLEDVVGDFRAIGELSDAIHLIAIAIICIGLMQFFRYFSFDKRLGIVTATMGAALKDLLPVLLIFATVLLAYGVLGTEIYGTQLEEWSDLGKSLASLFILLLGEWGGYYEMREVNSMETGIFFWTFVVVIAFILFNMVLAVIFTVYDEKYGEIHEGLEKQAREEEAATAVRNQGRRTSKMDQQVKRSQSVVAKSGSMVVEISNRPSGNE